MGDQKDWKAASTEPSELDPIPKSEYLLTIEDLKSIADYTANHEAGVYAGDRTGNFYIPNYEWFNEEPNEGRSMEFEEYKYLDDTVVKKLHRLLSYGVPVPKEWSNQARDFKNLRVTLGSEGCIFRLYNYAALNKAIFPLSHHFFNSKKFFTLQEVKLILNAINHEIITGIEDSPVFRKTFSTEDGDVVTVEECLRRLWYRPANKELKVSKNEMRIIKNIVMDFWTERD